MRHSDVPRILANLKVALRARGITYACIAGELGVHQATVKRYLKGEALSLATLERICGLADLRLADLSDLAGGQEESHGGAVTPQQEAALVANRFRAFVFYLLQCGWSPRRIQAEFKFTEGELIGHLHFLDQTGLVRLLPGNRVRVLVKRRPAWASDGLARRSIDAWVGAQFSPERLNSLPSYEVETVKISQESYEQLRQMMRDVADAAGAAAVSDRFRPPHTLGWHAIMMAIRPVDPSVIPGRD